MNTGPSCSFLLVSTLLYITPGGWKTVTITDMLLLVVIELLSCCEYVIKNLKEIQLPSYRNLHFTMKVTIIPNSSHKGYGGHIDHTHEFNNLTNMFAVFLNVYGTNNYPLMGLT